MNATTISNAAAHTGTPACAREGCGRSVRRGQIYCAQHVKAVRTYENKHRHEASAVVLPSTNLRRFVDVSTGVCPLHADEPVWFGHHYIETAQEGGFLQVCACGATKFLDLAGIRYEAEA